MKFILWRWGGSYNVRQRERLFSVSECGRNRSLLWNHEGREWDAELSGGSPQIFERVSCLEKVDVSWCKVVGKVSRERGS